MRALQATLPRAGNNPMPPSPRPPRSDRYKQMVLHCIALVVASILGLLMVIFQALPVGVPPEFGSNLGSSLSSLNISISHVIAQWNIAPSLRREPIAVGYTHMKLLLSFREGRLALCRPYVVPAFTQGPGNMTTVRSKALSTLAIVNDLGVKGLVSMLKGREVTIDVVAKAKRRLHLGPWWVFVFTFMAPTDNEGGGDWMILGGTLSNGGGVEEDEGVRVAEDVGES